ncbi:uncharacterized protein B0I36DRAFT_309194 [Microdochium trichocladiopsis]|uniref:Zn(2)-C6 fungal-type domain-containing protein n=1 Tax=Microdochium trichocladiopsis TaxID=1682393 RepID=A0A9P8YGY1_9PEZI|nr:uncharacterized protein B0I36DRAFT_309194 [Microdochium trichocladiopsis]KAH7039738.1 hypothetical protein B0I36DRAFT_309194 [Microdochium trichocladiopsis]
MTPTPPSTTTSTSGHSPEEQYRVVRRRNRVPLSCHPCRTRKLKCNRGHPFCENCVKRGDTSSCVYAAPTSRKKTQDSSGAAPTPDDMQNRIDRLEGLVLSLMHGGANIDPAAIAAAAAAAAPANPSVSMSAPSTTDSSSFVRVEKDGDGIMRDDDQDDDSDDDDDDAAGLAASVGFLKLDADKGRTMYIGHEHWHTLLADISEVKTFFNSHKKDLEKSYERVLQSKPPMALDSPIFLLSAAAATEVELRSELPSRSAVMTLVSRYFNSHDGSSCIIHGPTFQEELRRHWQDPSSSTVVWIGLLYSILCLGMLSYSRVGDEPPEWKGRTLDLAAEFRLRTVQCLNLSDYTKPREYTVETMILYLFGEFSSRYDADVSFWIISSTIARTAMRQGYHRDGKLFPSMSPFQAEMRRRVWTLVRMADIMFSNQVSLPSMIYAQDTDTELPSLLFDEEFGPETKVLPPSRPITEPTPIAYQVAKAKMAFEFGNILQIITRLSPPIAYDEILVRDAKLREAHSELPPHLKMQPLENSQDPVKLLVARLNLQFLFYKIMCILHRKHMVMARNNPRYAHSRRTAIEAALDMLELFRSVCRECEPNGRLRTHKWYVGSVSRDTLLATMLVLMEVHENDASVASGKRQDSQTMFFWTPTQRQEMIDAVYGVRDIWKRLAQETVEAYKAVNIIDIILAKINKKDTAQNPEVAMAENIFSGFSENSMKPEQSAAMTLGMMSSGLTPNTNFQSPGPTGHTYVPPDFSSSSGMVPDFMTEFPQPASGPFSPFSMFTNLPTANPEFDQSIDWSTFDGLSQNTEWPADMSAWNFFSGGGGEQQPPAAQSQSPNNPPTWT